MRKHSKGIPDSLHCALHGKNTRRQVVWYRGVAKVGRKLSCNLTFALTRSMAGYILCAFLCSLDVRFLCSHLQTPLNVSASCVTSPVSTLCDLSHYHDVRLTLYATTITMSTIVTTTLVTSNVEQRPQYIVQSQGTYSNMGRYLRSDRYIRCPNQS